MSSVFAAIFQEYKSGLNYNTGESSIVSPWSVASLFIWNLGYSRYNLKNTNTPIIYLTEYTLIFNIAYTITVYTYMLVINCIFL